MNKLLFVLLDGCNAATAESCMGYLSALTSDGKACYASHDCALPALSRPLYHCILTGLLPSRSGIVHNSDWQPHPAPTLFHRAHAAGLCTAAAAYHWIHELCNGLPVSGPEQKDLAQSQRAQGRLVMNPALPLSYGLFYNNDAYPDDHVFLDAEALRQHFSPHVLLAHSMGIDYAGHCHGADSAPYRNAVRAADMLLAQYLPLWTAAGYQVVITSDHGMSADRTHNGNSAEERRVPLWSIPPTPEYSLACPEPKASPLPLPLRQDEWFLWCCKLLNI